MWCISRVIKVQIAVVRVCFLLLLLVVKPREGDLSHVPSCLCANFEEKKSFRSHVLWKMIDRNPTADF